MTDFDAAAERLRAERQAETRRREEEAAAVRAEAEAERARAEAEAQAWRDEVAWFVDKAREAGRPTVPLRYSELQVIPATPKRRWWGRKSEQPPPLESEVELEVPGVRGWVVEGEPLHLDSEIGMRKYFFVTEDKRVYDLVLKDGSCVPLGDEVASGAGRQRRSGHFRQGVVPQPTEKAMRGKLVEEVARWD